MSPRLLAWLDCGKQHLELDLESNSGREQLREELARCDVLVTSARPAALARIGLDSEALTEWPEFIWAAITAHGRDIDRVGFGDDCAAVGGLVKLVHGEPRFIGDALADPLTGLEGALAVLARRGDGRGADRFGDGGRRGCLRPEVGIMRLCVRTSDLAQRAHRLAIENGVIAQIG